jgi:hypothetical protein
MVLGRDCKDGLGEDGFRLICERDGLLAGVGLAEDEGVEINREKLDNGVSYAITEKSDAVVSGIDEGLSHGGIGIQCALT